MKKRFLALLMTLMMSLGICGVSFAAENTGVVGFVNMQVILSNYPGMKEIAQQIIEKRTALQKDFNAQAPKLDDKAKAELQGKYNKELADFERSKMEPVHKDISRIVLRIAKENGINSVVNITAMIAGGKDLTAEVVQNLKK